MLCPQCGKEGRDDAKFCWNCSFDFRTARGESVSVGGDVGAGGVAGSGKVEAENIAGRDIIDIDQILVQAGVSSELELEKVLRPRLFTEGEHKYRRDVEQWVKLHRGWGEKPYLVKAELAGLQLDGVDLARGNLSGADLRETDLCQADLRGASLRGAKLFQANLRRANLGDADLRGADLRRADLSEANLRDAYLFLANLRGAYLQGTTMPDGRTYAPGMDLSQFGALDTPEV